MEEEQDMEFTTEELVENNNIILNALIDLLIEKKVLSETDLKVKLEKIEKELTSEHEGCECGKDSDGEDCDCNDDDCCCCDDESDDKEE